MSIKRVLVLVLALVMTVSAFAPSVAAVFNPETHHEHLEEKLNDPELVAKYEELKATVEYVAKDIEENHEEYYANGYAYAKENGYIDGAIEAIKVALETIPEIDLEGVGMTEELRATLETELDALVPTLEKLLVILESEEISEFDGFVNAALTLEGDLYLHMNNIYAILEQGSIDLNQFILVPAFYEGLRILEEEVIPAVEAAVEAFVQAVVDHVVEKLTPYYEKVVEVIGIARDTYERLVATIVKINLYVENAIDTVIATYNALVAKILEINVSIEEAIYFAVELYNGVIETVVNINNAVEKAPAAVKTFAEYVEAEITAYVTAIVNYLEAVNYGALNGNYELKNESLYVSLGYSPFGEELAEKLNLVNKYYAFELNEEYTDVLAGADLVTIKVDGDEFFNFTTTQIAGKAAEIVNSNEKLVSLYEHPVIGGYVKDFIAGYGIDTDAEAIDLDWSLYLNAEQQAALAEALAIVKANLIEQGVPEYYYIDLDPMVQQALEENGIAGLPGISIDIEPIEVPVADIVVYGIESSLYAYARYAHDLDELLDGIYAVAPEATVVLVGIDNPLAGLEMLLGDLNVNGVDFEDCVEGFEVVVQAFNLQLYLAGVKNENTIFVLENDADAIYEALHVYCDHVYDNCVDTDCNRCLEERVAPGHSFTNYVVQVRPTCAKEGSETAVCDNCDETHTRSIAMTAHTWKDATCTSPRTCTVCKTTQGTTIAHDYSKATCTEAKRCNVCGKVQGEPNGHKYGNWEIIEEATLFNAGSRKHTCRVCGHVETEVIPKVEPRYTVAEIVVTILAAIVFSVTVIALIARRLRKKDLIK